ncbi:ABC transporter substrate-binding protein [Subtercola vilae]|uniref:Carbohydrate ABC transporter substrate-binding protein n=1 Tax=Subtercola vilae TaxID=2056433 RepID=A0A4T2BZ14_9MICO|nr:ABC transporter substrate-binding protein [Subtercola vilae]TIH36639.1 carbohydrate ABC transporter substrate-binding protein [Subtercola vilae]
MKHRRFFTAAAATIVIGAVVAGSSGCSAQSSDAGGKVTITLAGPNQWNSDPSSFGPAWEDLVARFEKAEPTITVKTTVLPLAEFKQTLATQLAAATAPELIFAQTSHTPEQVTALDDYLAKPNPYVTGNTKWLDVFNQDYFGRNATAGRNVANSYEFIPLNLYIFGLYYNKDAFAKAGVSAVPETLGDLITACGKLKSAGFTPLAYDNSWIAQNSTVKPIMSMLLTKYFNKLNAFGADGKPGTSTQISKKDFSKAILTGEISPQNTPEIAAGLELAKKVVDSCATPNWSGVSPTGAAFTGGQEFLGGTAAMSFGANFSANNLAGVSWKWGTMPFPTVTKADSSLSTGEPARLGATIGGTSYMIPSYIKGAKLDAAIKFLQFVSSPNGAQPWLDATGGIPSLTDAKPAPGLEGLTSGDWALSPSVPDPQFIPRALSGQAVYTGFLTGSKSVDNQLSDMAEQWNDAAKEFAKDGAWTEDWATK